MAAVPSGYHCLWDEGEPESLSQSHTGVGDPHDVVIVGAGFTGLWTAHYLLELNPRLSILVLDRHRIGFGASGRNGGWCSAQLPMSLTSIAAHSSREAAIGMQSAMRDTVRLIGDETRTLGIDCDYALGGTLEMSRLPAHDSRIRSRYDELVGFGLEAGVRLLDARQTADITPARGVRGGLFDEHCAAIHPGKLVRGLGTSLRQRGVLIHEGVEVLAIRPGRVLLASGAEIPARHVIRATEGFTSSIEGLRRRILPIHSLMIATEPLDSRLLDSVGLADRTTFNDSRHMVIYGQRTADDRVAFGGRGAPYHYSSSVDQRFSVDGSVANMLFRTLVELFPDLSDTRITHHWGGPLGATRDWWTFVEHDASTGLSSAGGYVGDGVTTSNLAGRTLARLLCGIHDPLVGLPWVGRRSRNWEPEPLRWLGVRAMGRLARQIDLDETRDRPRARFLARLLNRALGH